MASRPVFRCYVADAPGKEGKFDWKEEAFALWEDERPDKHGNTSYSGKTKDGRRVKMYRASPKGAEVEPVEPDSVPF